jgi:hypothetical protein
VQINTDYQSDAHGNLKRWLSGDHQVNNDIRNH